MIRRPPRSTQSRSSAASDVYKRQPLLGRNRVVAGGRSDRLGQWVVGAFEHHRAFREIAGMRRLVLFLAMPFDGHDDEHESQNREDEGLDEVEQRLQADD